MNQERENCILIDWFAMSFRDKFVTVHDIIKLLKFSFGMDKWEQRPGRYRYRDCIFFGHISIYYNNLNKDNDFPLLEMSGQGCREFETYSPLGFEYLFNLVKEDSEKYHMARLDVSFDEFTGVFDILRIFEDYRAGNWVSVSTRGMGAFDMHRRDKDYLGYSVTTGSKSSDMYMRIYDKAIQLGYFDGRHWNRAELVLKQDRATAFIKNPAPLGEKYRGVISDYFRFVKPSKKDSNKWRWKTRDYWENFLGAVEPISLFTPKNIDYNLPRLQKYVLDQAGNSYETYIRCVGMYDFFDHLIHRGTKGLTPQQRFLVKECRLNSKKRGPFTFEEFKKICEFFGEEVADQSGDGEAAAASEPQLVPSESSNVGQLPDEADPFADIPLPELPPLPSDWYDDS